MPNDTDEILTVSEVADRLRVPSSWVYGHADALGAYRLGKYLRFSWKRILEHLEATSNCNGLGLAAQRPQTKLLNSEGCNSRGTTKEQK